MTLFAAAVLRSVRTRGGATFDASGQEIDSGALWLFPAHPGQTLIVAASADWSAHLAQFVAGHRHLVGPHLPEWRAFGAWVHPGGSLYLDVTTGRTSREEAIREALARGEREGRRIAALYQASTRTTLALPPTL